MGFFQQRRAAVLLSHQWLRQFWCWNWWAGGLFDLLHPERSQRSLCDFLPHFSPLPARPVLVGERCVQSQSTPEPHWVKMSLSAIKLLLVLSVLFICSIDQAQARPRAHIVGNHIMKRQRNAERKISNNKTGKKWRQTKHIKHKNRNLIKSLLAFQEDYEEYDAPIIEIRFKREASLKRNILQQKFLTGKNQK